MSGAVILFLKRPQVTNFKQAGTTRTLRDSGGSAPDIARNLRVSIPTVDRITKAPAAR